MNDNTLVFCFGIHGFRDNEEGRYHPVSLYYSRGGVYREDDAINKIDKAMEALPKEPEEYTRVEAGRGGWVRFDYHGLISGEKTTTIEVIDNE